MLTPSGFFICYDRDMKTQRWILGIDEVGRGPLAGPVYVCAVLMKTTSYKKQKWRIGKTLLRDSKQMTKNGRGAWYQAARRGKQHGTLFFAVAKKSATYIDRHGISFAIKKAIEASLNTLSKRILFSGDRVEKVYVLLDGGLRAPACWKHQRTIVRGDATEKIISLASVIAKVTRDRYMVRLHKKYPLYGWDENKGYGTKKHRKVLIQQGISPFHRTTYLTKILDKS